MVSGTPTTPMVSVGMPVFNGERTMRVALASVLAPPHENLEVLERVATADPKNRVRAAAVEAIGEVRAERSEEIPRGIVEADADEGVKRAAEEALEDLHRGGFDDE